MSPSCSIISPPLNLVYFDVLEPEIKTSKCKTYFDLLYYSLFQSAFSIPLEYKLLLL